MKEVVDGVMYDTEKSELLRSWDNGEYGSLFYIEENLYKTKKGQYFLQCEGGAGTVYCSPASSGGTKYGERILPVNEEEANEFMNGNRDVTEIALMRDGKRQEKLKANKKIWKNGKRIK